MKFLTKWILYAFVIAAVYVAVTASEIWNYGKADEKTNTDVAIVLGAGTHDGVITPVFMERVNHGIWLYQNGYVEKLILTGGFGEGNEISDAFAAKLYAMEQGISEKDILIEEESRITQENLENAKRIMDENFYDTAIIVSDPLHMKRAMLLAKDCGITAYSSPTPTSRYVSLKSRLGFLAREIFYYTGYKVYRIFVR